MKPVTQKHGAHSNGILPDGFGWSSVQGFQTVNDWTVIPGVGNYKNLERGV
jgi:hypothetical protein